MIVEFRDNEPKTLSLEHGEGYRFSDRFNNPRIRYNLVGGDVLFVDVPTSNSIRNLELQPGEAFCICTYKKGRNRLWNVWLSPGTEKARAEAEKPQVASMLEDMVPVLRASVEAVQRKKAGVLTMPAPKPSVQPAPELPATGTYGAVPQRIVAAGSVPPHKLPFDVAFREVVRLVNDGLEANHEQWNDEARQGMVSTILIAASQHGWVTLWERPAA